MIQTFAALFIGAIIGFGACSFFAAGAISDMAWKLSGVRLLLRAPRTIRKRDLAAVLDGEA